MEYLIAQAAALVGIHPVTARRLCAKQGIGRKINARLRLLSEADVKRLKKLKKPNCGPRKRRKSLSG